MNHKTILSALLIMAVIAAAVMIAAMIAESTRQEVIHPQGQMTGDEQIHPFDQALPNDMMITMDEMIYIPAYPDENCTASDRILIDTPIRVVDADGTVYWHWFYDNRTIARDRTATAPTCLR